MKLCRFIVSIKYIDTNYEEVCFFFLCQHYGGALNISLFVGGLT